MVADAVTSPDSVLRTVITNLGTFVQYRYKVQSSMYSRCCCIWRITCCVWCWFAESVACVFASTRNVVPCDWRQHVPSACSAHLVTCWCVACLSCFAQSIRVDNVPLRAELYKVNEDTDDAAVRLEDIDEYAKKAITREQIIRRHIKSLLGAALRHMGLQRFLEIVPLKSPTSGTLATVSATAGVSDDRMWVLHLIR